MYSKIRVAAYCRVSTDLLDQVHSLEAQIRFFTDYISEKSEWELTEVYFDEGISGTSTRKRDGFNRMIADCEVGKIDLILTKEVSRFARNTVDTLNFTRKLSDLKIGVIFMNDGIDTRDKDGELRLTIMASLAQEESRKTSERVKWGIRRKMENGKILGCGRIYGYQIKDGNLIPIPNECEIIRQIFYSYLYEGKGTTTISKELTAKAVPTLNGKAWGAGTVLKILKNEKYVGDLTQGKYYTENHLSHKRVKNDGQNPEIPIITIRDHHEGIISREVWDGVQAELERRGQLTKEGRKHSRSYWHSGKVSCGTCGRPYNITGVLRLQNRALRCVNRYKFGNEIRVEPNGGTVGCNSQNVNERVLEACMKTVLEQIQICRDEIVEKMLAEIRQIQETQIVIDCKPLKTEIEKLKQKKRKAIDLMLEDLLSKEDLKQQADFYDSEIARLTKEIAESQNIGAAHKNQLDGIRKYISKINSTEKVDSADIGIYRELLDKIVVQQNQTVDIYLNCVPFGFRLNYHTHIVHRTHIFDVFINNCEVLY